MEGYKLHALITHFNYYMRMHNNLSKTQMLKHSGLLIWLRMKLPLRSQQSENETLYSHKCCLL